MRDILTDLTSMPSDPDPVRRAQIAMKKPLPKRFYKQVSIGETASGFAILLDGKTVKTPAHNALSVPGHATAKLLREEWDAQIEVIDPARMPFTRIINTAIDGVAKDSKAVFDDIVRFSGSDLLCYRADSPQNLVDRQAKIWDPTIEWAARTLGARFILAEGVIFHEQPAEAIRAFAAALQPYDDPISLTCLHMITTLTGSALLALAFAESRLDKEQVWAAAHVDEDFNIEQWGTDEEAALRAKLRRGEMSAVSTVFRSNRP